jgi:hypothetical protein
MRMGNRVARLVRQAGSGQSARGLVSLRADSATSSDWGKSKPGQPCQGGQADSDHSHMREEMIHEKHENEHATMHQNSDEPTLSSHVRFQGLADQADQPDEGRRPAPCSGQPARTPSRPRRPEIIGGCAYCLREILAGGGHTATSSGDYLHNACVDAWLKTLS